MAAKAGAVDYLVKHDLSATLLERSIRYAVEHGRALKAERKTVELEGMNLAKNAFLAAMSHEIRTPLNAILGLADVLAESPLNTEQTRHVEVMRRAGSRLLLSINDILDVSSIDAGQLKLEHIAFDLEDVVDQAIELFAERARAKEIVLLSHLPPGVTTSLLGDPNRLSQVLMNLLGNALKFTAAGEVVLTVRAHESGTPGHIEFAVSDTGIGIAPDKLEEIFEDFTQADASVTRKYGGMGLGLGISRRLVEGMGGRLTAISTVGRGSTFRFTARFDVAPESRRKIHIAREDFHGKRVLVIDDNATNCLILRETLQAWGLECDVFLSTVEALERLPKAMAGKDRYSLAIVDSHVPGMDAFQAAAEIRRIAGDLPIVMLTSDVRAGDTTRRAEAGLAGCAVKPVTRTHLLRLVCQALQTTGGVEPYPTRTVGRPAKKDSAKRDSARPACILVVEDSPDNRMLVEVYLSESPYWLTFEEDGKAAVDRFTAADFDLILMDVQMPVMDGLAATSAIRAIERTRGTASIPIIALTAYASLQDIEKSKAAGCTAHLTKPVSKFQLLSTIEQYL